MIIVFICTLAALSALTTTFADLLVHETRDSVPAAFISKGAAPVNQLIVLRVALVQNDVDGLEKILYDVSTPGSALYGQHLSKEEVENLLEPKNETVSMVNAFFESHNVSTKAISPAGNWLSFSVPISKANAMFNAHFEIYEHVATGNQFFRTLSYSIPQELKGHLDLVHPTVTFDPPFLGSPIIVTPLPLTSPENNLTSRDSVLCATLITPVCLQTLYGIPSRLATQKSNVLAVPAFAEQYAQNVDLKVFLSGLRPDLNPNTTFSFLSVDGGINPQGPDKVGILADIGIEYTVGVASGVPVLFASVGLVNHDNLNGFVDLMNVFIGMETPPRVIALTYNADESDLSSLAQMQLCTAVMTLGMRGVSVLSSSGDGGVAGSPPKNCTEFIPTFPSTCPYITTVGATSGINPEIGATFSSGGFSNIFPRAQFQASVVLKYLTSIGSLNAGQFNPTGRAYPDVAAQGENIEIAFTGLFGLVSGTECSSPIFASAIALVNDRLIACGRNPLGFLNPLLYSPAGIASLTDITRGNNPGCNTNGFPAKSGWDPVTGLGTPNFEQLLALVGLTDSDSGDEEGSC